MFLTRDTTFYLRTIFFLIIYSFSGVAENLKSWKLWIGTRDDGLYVCDINSSTGELGSPRKYFPLARTISTPSHSTHLYTAGKNSENDLVLESIQKMEIKNTNSKVVKDGGSCYLSISQDQRFLFSADIKNGKVFSFLLTENGDIGKIISSLKIDTAPGRKKFAPHAAVLSPDGKFLIVPDIAGNRICQLEVNLKTGELKLKQHIYSDNFKGPRHFVFNHKGDRGYLVNQTGESVTTFSYTSETGELLELDHDPTLPSDQLEINNHIAEIEVHPSGKFLYVSNRGHQSLSLLNVNSENGELDFIKCFSSHGEAPWSFEISPCGQFLFCSNLKSNNVVVFYIDETTGELKPTGQTITIPEPICLKIID